MRVRIRAGMVLALMIALLAAACGGEGGGDSSTGSAATEGDAAETESTEASETATVGDTEMVPIRYGLPTSTYFITTVGVQFALQNGYFEEEGLDVVVTPLPGATTAIRALLSGEQDIVLTGGDTAFLAWQNGAPIKIIDSPIAKGTDVLIARSGITTIQDLAGGRYAISDPGSTAEVLGRILLERNGVDPTSVQFVALGSPADRVRALLAGQVDATAATILVLEPVIEAIEQGQVEVLTSFAEEFPDVPLTYNVTTDRMIEDQPDVLVRFLRAELRGYRWAQENPEEAAAIAVEFIEETEQALLEQGMQGMVDLDVFGLDGGISPDAITRTQEALVELGQLSEVSEPQDVANFELVEEAVAGLDG